MKCRCDELGVRHGGPVRCEGCEAAESDKPFYFAPGVIDDEGQSGFGFVPSDAVGAVVLVAVAYFLAGWLA